MKILALLAAALFAFPVYADEKPWVFEFEFDYGITANLDRLLLPDCDFAVPSKYLEWYEVDPRAGYRIACGNDQPMYQHFLGRRCWKPLPNFQMDCGWRHFSSPGDNHEITFDAIAIRGSFRFGGRRG